MAAWGRSSALAATYCEGAAPWESSGTMSGDGAAVPLAQPVGHFLRGRSAASSGASVAVPLAGGFLESWEMP
ncbi:MAG: hypothetical protein MH825_08275 [Cyanobacteria bacterium]|nr:hypothetical protein [Cyanobacteriota bacterium]